MSVTFSSLWSRLFAKRETKVLILGLDNAGKVRVWRPTLQEAT